MIKAKLQPLVLEVSKFHSSFHLGTHRYRLIVVWSSSKCLHGTRRPNADATCTRICHDVQVLPLAHPLFLEVTSASSIRFLQYHTFHTPCLMCIAATESLKPCCTMQNWPRTWEHCAVVLEL